MNAVMPLPVALQSVSMVCANFGNGATLGDVLQDWFDFLGGRPGEVVIVDGGSDAATQEVCWELFQRGLIDKLQLIRPDHPENHKDLCFIQEHTAGALASRPYLLFFKSDTLPYRQGHNNWLAEALAYLERGDTFAVGGSFNVPSKHHEAWPGWYFSDKCSENFALMKRRSFMAAMQELAGEYIASGFRGENPAAKSGQERWLIEVAFERYIQRHQCYTLVREEDASWTVFHTNVSGERLVRVRRDYLARKDIARHLNAGRTLPLAGGCYYGQKRRRLRELRVAIGASAIGPYWRAAKQWLGKGRATP